VLPTLRRRVLLLLAVNIRLLGLLFYYINFYTHKNGKKIYTRHMSEKRTWDESRSPQWRYLLSKDSAERHERRRKEERTEQAEGELGRRVSKRKRLAQERHRENRKLKSKSGKEIVYSAFPGSEKNRYHDPKFVSRKKTPKIFTNIDNDDTE